MFVKIFTMIVHSLIVLFAYLWKVRHNVCELFVGFVCVFVRTMFEWKVIRRFNEQCSIFCVFLNDPPIFMHSVLHLITRLLTSSYNICAQFVGFVCVFVKVLTLQCLSTAYCVFGWKSATIFVHQPLFSMFVCVKGRTMFAHFFNFSLFTLLSFFGFICVKVAYV